LIRRRLIDSFPDHGVVAEEGTNIGPKRNNRWYVDPLDGTVNFSRGVPMWCVSLALFADGFPVLGVIHDPIRGETFSAAKGGGAWCNGERIQTSQITELSLALVHLTIEFHEGSIRVSLDDLASIAPAVLRTRNMGSAALALAYVATGRMDAMIHRSAFPWDYGAGVLLVQEAGGVVSGIGGEEYSVGTSALVAASGRVLHDRTMVRLQRSPTTYVEWPGHST
jgi:myo-inositol-1(or 4)-monophosphatase